MPLTKEELETLGMKQAYAEVLKDTLSHDQARKLVNIQNAEVRQALATELAAVLPMVLYECRTYHQTLLTGRCAPYGV